MEISHEGFITILNEKDKYEKWKKTLEQWRVVMKTKKWKQQNYKWK